MQKFKSKVLLFIGVFMLLGVVTLLNFELFPGPENIIIKSECDYDGLREFHLLKTDGNATTNPSITLKLSECDKINEEDLELVFALDGSRLADNDVQVKWKSFDTIQVKYNSDARVIVKESKSRSIAVPITIIYESERNNRINGILNDSIYTVIEFDPEYHMEFENSSPTTLSYDDFYEVEQILEVAIKDYNSGLDDEEKLYLQQYKRQYVPVINKSGQKEVYINFFCDDPPEYWKDDLMIVEDGGKCYFQIKINISEMKYYDFHVNGIA